MTMAEESVAAYLAAWNEPDRAKRLTLLDQVWSQESRYVDPNADVTGPEGLSGYIDSVHKTIPGCQLALKGGIAEHHGHLRFDWVLNNEAGETLMHGVDFVTMAPDGRLVKVVGFLYAD